MQKWAAFALAGVALLLAPVALLSSAGSRLSPLDQDTLGTSVWTFANLGRDAQEAFGSLKNNTCLGTADSLCPYQTLPLPGMPEQAIDFLLLYSVIFVLLACVLMLGFALEWRWFSTQRYLAASFRRPRVAQYSVLVSGFPQGVSTKQIVEHFDDLYTLDHRAPEKPSLALCRLRPRVPFSPNTAAKFVHSKLQSAPRGTLNPAHKVKNAKLSGRHECVGTWVADVQIITQNSHILRAFEGMQRLKYERDELQAQQMKFADNSPQSNSALHEEAIDLKADTDIVLGRLDEQSRKLQYSGRTVSAFVTFNNEESWQRAVDDYSRYSGWCSRHLQPSALRFRSRAVSATDCLEEQSQSTAHALSLQPADHPEDTLWTSITASNTARTARAVLFCICAVCCMLFFLALHSSAVRAVSGALKLQARPAVCAYLAPAAAANSLLFPDAWVLSRRSEATCPQAQQTFLAWEGNEIPPPGQPKAFTVDPCFGGCVSAAGGSNGLPCRTQAFLSGNQTVHKQVLLNSVAGHYTEKDLALCYCKAAGERLVAQFGIVQAVQRFSSNAATAGFCEEMLEAALVLQGFGPGYGALLAVLMQLSSFVSTGLNRMLLHSSKASRQRSAFRTQVLLACWGVVICPFIALFSNDTLQGVALPGIAVFDVCYFVHATCWLPSCNRHTILICRDRLTRYDRSSLCCIQPQCCFFIC